MTTTFVPWELRNYSHSYWLNGWRKHPNDSSADLLCFETGHYGLIFDTKDLTQVNFAIFSEEEVLNYVDVLDINKKNKRMGNLNENSLLIQLTYNGRVYRATTCLAGNDKAVNRLGNVRLWEAGKIAQYYEIMGLSFLDDSNNKLEHCTANLDVYVWPETFSLCLKLSTNKNNIFVDQAEVMLKFQDYSQKMKIKLSEKESNVTLFCNISQLSFQNEIKMKMTASKIPQRVLSYDKRYCAYVCEVNNFKRDFKVGYTDIRQNDRFHISIENLSDKIYHVPFYFYLKHPANITGLVPMIKRSGIGLLQGQSGIPIQLSKNWHYPPEPYLRGYALIPANPDGFSDYVLDVYYGFYGDMPSASHANLSLVGWRNDNAANGRWEQLAIGCFGETFCIDAEMSATDQIITDVRGLMIRKGKDGKMWGWTNGGWGGDWLVARIPGIAKMFVNEVKVAYISHGPCLTDVRYSGYYGQDKLINFFATVRTLRTDDYARTFHTLHYEFHGEALFYETPGGSCFFRMGGRRNTVVPTIVIGNRDGSIAEYHTKDFINKKKQSTFLNGKVDLTGPSPWFIAYPRMQLLKEKEEMGLGWKALIIRSYEANIGKQCYENPTVAFYIREKFKDYLNIDTLLQTPNGIKTLNKGDSVKLDVEWVVLPHLVDDYYGANELFRSHLTQFPDSWKSILREAKGNDFNVQVDGGSILNKYPLIILCSPNEKIIRVDIESFGDTIVGALPIRFDGLDSRDYKLYYLNKNNNHIRLDGLCQLDYMHQNTSQGTYSLSFNIHEKNYHKTWFLKI